MTGVRTHALLGASSAERWLACPPSARLEATLPDRGSPWADEGILAHRLAALVLADRIGGRRGRAGRRAQLTLVRGDALYRSEMDEAAAAYATAVADAIRAFPAPPHAAVEKRLDYSAFVPEGFGTADCVAAGTGALHVFDFKYGRGVPVTAFENPQLKLYALGALAAYGFLIRVRRVVLTVVQPRLEPGLSRWETTPEALTAWGESIRPAALAAWEGRGEMKPGPHCRFCRARAACRARADHYAELDRFALARPPLITNAETADILTRADGLAAWLKALETYALGECLAGREVPGFKAVEGRRARVIADYEKVSAALTAAGLDESRLWRREPATAAELEKLLGRGQYDALVAPHVTLQPGRPALVPASDRRPALVSPEAAPMPAEETGE